jgi:plasmid maintenance system antidote protein VapI
MMSLAQLHEHMRSTMARRIDKGTMTVSLLSRLIGVGQPHVSSFVHGKRRLSLRTLDRVLSVQNWGIETLPKGDETMKAYEKNASLERVRERMAETVRTEQAREGRAREAARRELETTKHEQEMPAVAHLAELHHEVKHDAD